MRKIPITYVSSAWYSYTYKHLQTKSNMDKVNTIRCTIGASIIEKCNHQWKNDQGSETTQTCVICNMVKNITKNNIGFTVGL